LIATAGLLAPGCATKKYVRNTAAPIQAKVDQVGEQTTRNGQSIEETKTQVKQVDDRATSGINAAQERASTADQHALAADQHANTADQHANDAINKATQASQSADRTMASLRSVVANLDDYKLQTSVSVPFAFNQYGLTKNAKQELDQVADAVKADKRYFIAVEGYTDKTGTVQYNEVLSRHRADSVVGYLVGQHDVPIYRIHTIGLGEQKPVDEGRGRDANAKNRRVEVKVFIADVSSTLAATPPGATAADRASDAPNR
jgi:OOP family OmpA-OmpF porin